MDALIHRRNILARNYPPHNLVFENVSVTTPGWRHLYPAVTVLASPTGLLLVFSLYLGGPSNGFQVGNLGSFQHDFHAKLAFEFLNDDLQVYLPHAGDDELLG